MTDTTTSPSGTVDATPLSFDQGVDAIAGLLDDDPVTEPVKTEVANSKEPAPAAEPIEGEELSDDDLLLENVELDEVAEPEIEAPTAVTDDTEVELEDGTKISIAQLKRNNLFQRDYTRKTEELAQQRRQLDQEYQQRVSEAERDIAQRRDLILELASQFIPQKPSMELMQQDPLAYMEQQALYEQNMQKLQALHQHKQQETAAQAQRRQQEEAQFIQEQRSKVLELLPHLKDDKKREAFRSDIAEIGIKKFGITPDEVNSLYDARYMRILHDAIAYQKLKDKAGSIQKTVTAKPKLVQQQRMAPQAVQNRDRQGRFEALRQTGSLDAAAKSIEDLID
jgi:hypothetical protein